MSREIPATVALPRAPTIAELPGLRTLRSPGFRALVAACLCLVGVTVLGLALLRQASDPRGQFGIDFGAYYAAAERVGAGSSPYTPAMLDGPIAAQGVDQYLYPPVMAQLLVPIFPVSRGDAATAWVLIQALAVLAATWVATGLGGARRSAERALWCAVAATWFLPVFDSAWKGNVSDILALQVAVALAGGAAGGTAIALAVLLKVMPIMLVSPAAGGGRRIITTALLVGLGVAGASLLASPHAWADYARVLPNLAAGAADDATNLSPWAVLAHAGAPVPIVGVVRLAGIACALLMALAAYRVASRPGGWHAAVALGTCAMLLLPAALWYHYFAVLLPLAAVAWPLAPPVGRVILLCSASMISLGVACLPLASVGALVLGGAAILILLPGPAFAGRRIGAAVTRFDAGGSRP